MYDLHLWMALAFHSGFTKHRLMDLYSEGLTFRVIIKLRNTWTYIWGWEEVEGEGAYFRGFMAYFWGFIHWWIWKRFLNHFNFHDSLRKLLKKHLWLTAKSYDAMIEQFVIIVASFQPSTVFAKILIIDVWQVLNMPLDLLIRIEHYWKPTINRGLLIKTGKTRTISFTSKFAYT